MTDQTVRVRLEAVTNLYTAAMARAGQSTTTFARSALASTRDVATGLQSVQTEATVGGAALLGIGIAAVAASTNFDKAMSNVKAVSGATTGQMDKLRQAALDAGQATVFSASQAAEAEAELAKAGVRTSDILGGALSGSLSLAAAGQIDLAQAATISAQAMNVFGLKGKDVGHIADVLAAGANKSAADVDQLGQALQQGGLVAQQTGLSLEDTVGVLSAFADRALIGSDAGTSLKTMLQRLVNPSGEAKDAMDELGITAYDAQGNFVGLEKFAGSLRNGLKDLDPAARGAAMSVIFGSDAVRAANVIYDLGEQGVRDYTRSVNDQGAASRMAATQLDNLAGDLEQLRGSIETTLIKTGAGGNDALRTLTQTATGAVNVIGNLPAPILLTSAAVAIAGGSFLIAAPRVADFNAALATTPGLARAAGASMKALGPIAVVAAIAGITSEVDGLHTSSEQVIQDFQDLKKEIAGGVKMGTFDELSARMNDLQKQANDLSSFDWTDPFKSVAELWDRRPDMPIFLRAQAQAGELQSELERVSATATEAEQVWSRYTEAIGNVAVALGITGTRAKELADESGVRLDGTVKQITDGVLGYVAATQQGSVASQQAAAGMDVLNDSTADVASTLDALNKIWDATIGLMLGVSDAKIGAEQALADLIETIKENGNAWDITTKAGRENVSAWNDLVNAAGEVRAKKLEEGASVDQANAAYRRYLERVKEAPGVTDKERAAVQRLIDKYDDLPEVETTKVTADTSQAMAKLSALASLYRSLGSSYAIGGSTYNSQVPAAAAYPASGGWITPTGLTMRAPFATRGTDIVPAMLTPGEAVVKKDAARRNAPIIDAMNAGAVISTGYSGAGASAVPPRGSERSVTFESHITAVASADEAAAAIAREHGNQAFLYGFEG